MTARVICALFLFFLTLTSYGQPGGHSIIIPANTIRINSVDTISNNKIKMLADEHLTDDQGVNKNYTQLTWQGLFYHGKNYYVKPVKIRLKRERSATDEDTGRMTGWRLTCNNKDHFLMLISGCDFIVNGPVKVALQSVALKRAGQKMQFNYNGNNYTLYTTGRQSGEKVYNYKLFLLANVKGHYYNQLLYQSPDGYAMNAGGDMAENIEIELAGDIDGDKIPDFIISGSGYAFGNYQLFLSKPAGNKAILKPVAEYDVTN